MCAQAARRRRDEGDKMRYSDCYPGCGGEDCPCCEIHIDHLQNYGRDQHYPGPWRRLFEEDFDPNKYEEDDDD